MIAHIACQIHGAAPAVQQLALGSTMGLELSIIRALRTIRLGYKVAEATGATLTGQLPEWVGDQLAQRMISRLELRATKVPGR